MNIIVAVDTEWGIGKNNGMLFHLPADLKYFKEKTYGKIVVMGGNTLLSFPGSKPLPGRRNIVLTDVYERDDCEVYKSLPELLAVLKTLPEDDIFIVGGAMFYKTMLPYCKKAYVTKIDATGDATHFFPNLDVNPDFNLKSVSDAVETNGYRVVFTVYENRNIRAL